MTCFDKAFFFNRGQGFSCITMGYYKILQSIICVFRIVLMTVDQLFTHVSLWTRSCLSWCRINSHQMCVFTSSIYSCLSQCGQNTHKHISCLEYSVRKLSHQCKKLPTSTTAQVAQAQDSAYLQGILSCSSRPLLSYGTVCGGSTKGLCTEGMVS